MPRARRQGKTPDLRFGWGSGSISGFTPAGVAAFDNLRPAAVVRELIQNALDAAKSVDVKPAIVRFRLRRVERDSVPGLSSYKRAFEQAVKSQKELMRRGLAPQAELVRKRISGALAQEHLDVLSVLDNGVGLNPQRMTALLSDGLSVKEGGATGTYGNGHSSAIPASDLRYVLYGGVTRAGRRIAAGHAVLASHRVPADGHVRAGDGLFVRDLQSTGAYPYEYASAADIPALIGEDLDRIKQVGDHGTAIVIPAFNHFLQDRSADLWNVVAHAASANFFVAIAEGELRVEVQDARDDEESPAQDLNSSTLRQVLDAHKEKYRAKSFLSGQKAFDAERTYRRGEPQTVDTSKGKIEVRLGLDAPRHRIDLCRNGMWITDSVPGFYGKFADREPFHAVLSLKAEQGGDLHDLIRSAEGPLHDNLELKRLEVDERSACRAALKEIVEWLRKNTAALKSEAFASNDFLTLEFGLGPLGGVGGVRASRGAPVVVGRRPAQQLRPYDDEGLTEGPSGPQDGSGDKGASWNSSSGKERRRPTLPALVQAASRPAGERRRHIHLHFRRSCKAAQMRLLVHEGLDATCDRHGMDEYQPAVLNNVTIGSRSATETELARWNGQPVGVRLGDVAADETRTVETGFSFSGEFADLPEPALRIEVFSAPTDESAGPASQKDKSGGAANA